MENAWRHCFAVGLAWLAGDGTADPREALEKLEACVADRFGRYNEESEETSGKGV